MQPPSVERFAQTLEKVCISTVESGRMTKDLALLIGPNQNWMTTQQFLDAVDHELKATLTHRKDHVTMQSTHKTCGRENTKNTKICLNPTLLGVLRSATGQHWVARREDQRAVLSLCQRHTIPELLARVLTGRNIGLDQAPDYLIPRLRNSLPDPFGLRDMENAATIIADRVQKKAPIGLLTDYDVDGATSAGLMIRYLNALGVPDIVPCPGP